MTRSLAVEWGGRGVRLNAIAPFAETFFVSATTGDGVAEVLDTIDIGSIVRESTGSVTGDIVDSARVQSMQLDTLVNRIVDTMLLRRRRHRAHVGDDWAVGRRGSDDPVGAADDEAVEGVE